MNLVPTPHKFEWLANSTNPDDTSGKATWHYSSWESGEWVTKYFTLELSSFVLAHSLNDVMNKVWEAGEANGYSNCERKVLQALLS